jgi:hypothetical protein
MAKPTVKQHLARHLVEVVAPAKAARAGISRAALNLRGGAAQAC